MSGAYEEYLYELPDRLTVMAENEKRCGREGAAEDLTKAAAEIERLRDAVAAAVKAERDRCSKITMDVGYPVWDDDDPRYHRDAFEQCANIIVRAIQGR